MIKSKKLAFTFLLACIALLPVGFGGNRPLPFGLAQTTLGLSFALLALSEFKDSKNIYWPKRIRIALFLFACVLLWAFVQTLGFPPISIVHPLWQQSSNALGISLPASIAIDPEAARAGLSRLFTYCAAGLLGFLFCQSSHNAKSLIKIIYMSGFAICIYGLAMHIAGIEYVLGIKKWDYIGDLTATFINRNHFALYADMALLCGVALAVQSWRAHTRDAPPKNSAGIIKHWILKEGLARIFSLLIILFCVISSHSRAGLFLALASVVLFFLLYSIYRRNIKGGFYAGIIGIAVLALGTWFALHHLDRFALAFVDNSSQSRLRVYEICLKAIEANPWLGYGLNGFAAIFRQYQTGMVLEFNHAHSDILESLLDYGLPVATLLWIAFALLISGLWHGIISRKHNGIYPAVALATALIVLLHAGIDFSLQIPALSVLFATLMGMGLAQSWRRHE